MADKHLSAELLDRLMRDEIDPRDMRELAWHLLESCRGCAEAVEGADGLGRALIAPAGSGRPEPPASAPPTPSLDMIERRLRSTLELVHHEQRAALAFFSSLESLPVEHQCLVIRNSSRHHTASLCELVLDRAWELGFEDPRGADALAGVVMELAGELAAGPLGPYSAELLEDLSGRAWAYRGNFLRVRNELREADEAFLRAEGHLACGTGDQLELARLLDLKASLRCVQTRYGEAHELSRRAVAIFLSADEEHLAGRAMLTQSKVFADSEDPVRGLEVLQRALGLIDAEREPRLSLIAEFHQTNRLARLGRYQEAFALLPRMRRVTIERGTRSDLLRLRWIEGQVLLGLGHEERAEAAYLEVRKGFIEQGMAYDAALVSLDLGSLYVRRGQYAEARHLATELIPIFESRDVHQGALAALVLYKNAAESETVSLRLVEQLASFLARARHDSSARFEPVEA